MGKLNRPAVNIATEPIVIVSKAVANHWSKGPNAAAIRARLSVAASQRTGEKSGRFGKTKETNPAFSNAGAPKGTVPHNKDKKWEEYLSPEAIASIIVARTGRVPWNKDLHGYLSPEALANMSREGTTQSEESKLQTSLTLIEFYKDPEERKKASERMTGVPKPESMRQKTSERVRGPGNPWYIDGRCSGENYEYPIEFNEHLKECIRERDGHKCQICDVAEEHLEKKLDVHHIDYDKKNCDHGNLISLCHPCHMKTNVKRKTWISFFKDQQNNANVAFWLSQINPQQVGSGYIPDPYREIQRQQMQ